MKRQRDNGNKSKSGDESWEKGAEVQSKEKQTLSPKMRQLIWSSFKIPEEIKDYPKEAKEEIKEWKRGEKWKPPDETKEIKEEKIKLLNLKDFEETKIDGNCFYKGFLDANNENTDKYIELKILTAGIVDRSGKALEDMTEKCWIILKQYIDNIKKQGE